MAQQPFSPLSPVESKLQIRAQKYLEISQGVREKIRNYELAYYRLQKASQERQRRIARDDAMTKE